MSSLKILQLNVWGGRIKDGLTRFISEGDFDVVCMQEAIWEEKETGFLKLFVDDVDKIKVGAGFLYDYRSTNFGVKILNNEVCCKQGNVILSKIPFVATEEKVVLDGDSFATNASNFLEAIRGHRYTTQKVVLENGLVVVNYHGYWLPNPIGDETTVSCMRAVADMIRDENRPVVMCGDLNVSAESPAMRELDFLTDLTAVNKVKTTLRNVRFVADVACDHILVSKNTSYDNFKAVNAPVSDHKALTVEINL